MLFTAEPVSSLDTRNCPQKHARLARQQTMGFFLVVAKYQYTWRLTDGSSYTSSKSQY